MPTKPVLDFNKTMTPARFRECLKELGVSQRELAKVIGSARRLTTDWANGVHSVPPDIGLWLERCLRVKATHTPLPPPPKEWRRRYSLERIGRDALNRHTGEIK